MSETIAKPGEAGDPHARFRSPVPGPIKRAAANSQAVFDAVAAGNAPPQPSDGLLPLPGSPPVQVQPQAPSPTVVEPLPPFTPPAEPAAIAAEPPAEPPPAPPAPAAPAAPAEPVNWEHRYNSLKGKHDQVLSQVSALTNEVSSLHGVLASMRAIGPGAAPAAAPGAPLPTDLTFAPITDEERADYGDDFISVAQRAAAQRFAPVIQELQTKIAQLEGSVGSVKEVVALDAKQTAMTLLQSQVPDFEQMNTDPEFLAWLQGLDELSGQKRQDLLDIAVGTNNGPRIVAFFKAYKGLQTAAAPSPQPSPPAKARTSLETLAAPGRGQAGTRTAPPASAPTGNVYRQSQISAFYDDVRRGVYHENPAEKARIERDIIEASKQGRVIAG